MWGRATKSPDHTRALWLRFLFQRTCGLKEHTHMAIPQKARLSFCEVFVVTIFVAARAVRQVFRGAASTLQHVSF